MPPGVLLYYHLYPTVFAKVSAEECQLLVQAIFSTGGVCEMPELDKNLDIIWGLIKRLIDNNTANYQQKAQMNSEKGKKGAQKRAENLEAKRQKKIEEASAESLSFDQQAEANEQALSFDQQANNNNSNSNSNNDSNNMITNAHSADADEGSLAAACSADAAPVRALLPGNVRSFSGKAKQTQAPLSTLEAPLKHLEANQANQAVNVTVTVNGTGIVNVIDYSLLVQSALPSCERSAQFAPFAQLSLRLCARSCSHEKCARWRRIFTAAAKIG